MKRLLLSLLFLPCIMYSPLRAYAGFGEGRPVTAADFSGKKFCFNDGIWEYYEPNGKMTTSRGHGVWSVPQPGLIHHRYSYMQLEVCRMVAYTGLESAQAAMGISMVWGTPCQ